MNLFAWVIFGIFVGFVAHILDNRGAWGGISGAILFGIVGSLMGGLVATYIFETPFSNFDVVGFSIALAGALFFVLIQRTFFTRGEKF